jgi:hypothetical protein
LGGLVALGCGFAYPSETGPEAIEATVTGAADPVTIKLTIYNNSTAEDLQVLSDAYRDGQDSGLVLALSKMKAAGRCTMDGTLSYDVGFIRTIATATGRQVSFMTVRPLQHGLGGAESQGFELTIGQLELNDTDTAKSTGFVYPASKVIVDKAGVFRYDFAGKPWTLGNVLDSREVAAAE